MPLEKTQIDVLRGANQRLAVFGLFRIDENPPNSRWRFRKNADPKRSIHKLNAQSLFDQLKPELRFISDPSNQQTTITIADLTFLGYMVMTPARALQEGKATKEMQILRRSHLLDPPKSPSGNPDPFETAQIRGGELYSELLEQLDLLVGFDHPHFMAGLARLIHFYVPVKAHEKLDAHEKISYPALQRWLERDVVLRGQMTKYLLCLEDDEPAIGSELADRLTEIAKGSDDNPFNPEVEVVYLRQIGKVKEALDELKAGMLNNTIEVRAFLIQQAGSWVEDVSQNGNYKFDHPDIGANFDFFAIYRAAKRAHDWVSRFVRTEALHSYIVCWLASKYEAHKKGSVQHASKKMFEVGILKVQERKYPISRRDIRTYMGIIDSQAIQATERAKPEARTHLAVVRERLKLYFLPPNAYTRNDQLKRADRLFVTACQLAGGVTEEIHKKNMQFSDELNALQEPLLKYCAERRRQTQAESDDATQIDREQLKTILKDAVHGHDDFVDRTFGGLDAVTTARRVKETFVEAFSGEILGHFSTEFDDKYADIRKEVARLRNLFGLWCGAALEGKGMTSGNTFVVNLATLSREKRSFPEAVLKREQAERLKAKATATKGRVPSKVPAMMAAKLGARLEGTRPITGRILNGDDVVARTTIEVVDPTTKKREMFTERAPDTEANRPSELTDEQNLRVLVDAEEGATDQEPIEFNVMDLKELSVNEVFPLTTPAGKTALEAAADYDLLAEKLESCHKKYMEGRDQKRVSDALFRRTLRAAKLAQVILAAPRGSVNLDAQDLSNGIGLMQEMVEKFGEPKANMFANKPQPENDLLAAERLKDVNVSLFYPLADEDESDMDKILLYHYELCQKVTEVEGYLRELRELRDFFEAVTESEMDIEVVNTRLNDYCAGEDDLFYKEPPLALYLTAQSRPDATSLAAFQGYLTGLIGFPPARHLQFPAVFLAPGCGAPSATVRFPVFAADGIWLPDIERVVGRQRIQNPPHLLWVGSLLTGSLCDFHRYDPSTMPAPVAVHRDIQAHMFPTWDFEREPVHDYLRKTWTRVLPATRKHTHEVILLKWVNYGLLLGVVPGETPTGLQQTLTDLYGQSAGGEDVAPVRPLYLDVFRGLPFGQERLTVTVRPGKVGAAVDVFTTASPIPGSEFLIDGEPIVVTWL
jgi:hypothetical protein